MTTREIQGHLKDIYAIDVSPDLISRVTDSVKEMLDEWRARSLESFYPVLFLDAIRINIRDSGQVIKKAVYLALAIRTDGQKELLGMWIERNEGSKFWLGILNELKNRGVQDILMCAVDGLTGFPEAINAVFPKTEVQLCIVHMLRNSLRFVSYKDSKAVTADLKKVYLSVQVKNLHLLRLKSFPKNGMQSTLQLVAPGKTAGMRLSPSLSFPLKSGKLYIPQML